ncbi:MAG: fibrobacter succinogenes major paralogous domain-containing protein [Bacteroidales bacterium]|nr:fibrobacter succinogenes major paralogous domain-containing protein [Bacteroidales bacterium]
MLKKINNNQETHTTVTNANGLMTLQIGGGTVMNGDFASIDWANGPYFLKTETDPTGGTNYTIEGTQQMLSVPYALYAGHAANGFSGDYNDLTNVPPMPQIPENVSAFVNDAGYLTSVDCGNINICDLFAELQAQIEDLQHTVDSLSEHGGGEEETPVDALPCPGTPTVTDIDGNVYNTVRIGNQCWMKENLRTTHYADNTAIPAGSTTSYTEPYRYAPNNDESNVETYGYLYNWAAVMHGESSSHIIPSGVQGICPTGWHVPSDAEWTQLTDYVSSQSQYVCGNDNTYIAKALASTMGWYSSNITCAVGNTPSANNATGFSALPTGYYDGYSNYSNYFGNYANFWSATELNDNYAWHLHLDYFFADVGLSNYDKDFGFSVRCLRD